MTRAGAITETTLIAATDAGMHALWNPSRFPGIIDYDTWEDALLEDDDIIQRVRAGELVPVTLYLSDGTARLTGIEHICADPGPAAPALTVPAGTHAVTIHLIDWSAEPDARDRQGKPASGALPDFVVLISPERTTGNPYRARLQTFSRD
jgi:hypothetical protein